MIKKVIKILSIVVFLLVLTSFGYAFTISGIVKGVDNVLLENATVSVYNIPAGTPVNQTNTTINGSYSLEVPQGFYNITASHSIYGSKSVSRFIKNNETVDFILGGSVVILNGTVIDETNANGILNATLVIYLNNGIYKSTQTDSNGFYSLSVLDNKTYTIEVSAQGFLSKSEVINVLGNTTENINLTPTSIVVKVNGTIIRQYNGSGINNTNIELIQNNATLYSNTTNTSGYFEINNIRKGTYELKITKSGFYVYTETVTLNNNTTLTIELVQNNETRDKDGDGYGAANYGGVSFGNDLNDNDATIYPGAPELCDGKDNDQDGTIDEGCGGGGSTKEERTTSTSGGAGGGIVFGDRELFFWDKITGKLSQEINNPNIFITKITLYPRVTLYNVHLTIEDVLPNQLLKGIDAYRGARITVQNINENDLEKVDLYFRVSKEWYERNNKDVNTTKLYRLVNYKWIELPTEKIKEDKEYYYFKAESPGLSYFAASATEKQVIVEQQPEEETEEEKETTITEEKESIWQKIGRFFKNSWLYWIIGIGAVIVIIGIIFGIKAIVKRRKIKKGSYEAELDVFKKTRKKIEKLF